MEEPVGYPQNSPWEVEEVGVIPGANGFGKKSSKHTTSTFNFVHTFILISVAVVL